MSIGLVEILILFFLFMVFIWFALIEPKYGHYIPTVTEPWDSDSSYNRVSEDLDAWQKHTFGEEE